MIPFVKAHACGNDFLILDESVAAGKHRELAIRFCARNTGIGADGIEFLERRGDGPLSLRLFNSDGSEAELSGNGTRCVAAWLAHSEALMNVSLRTHGGDRNCRVVEANDPLFRIESGMGVPKFVARTIEVAGLGDVAGAVVNTGNPHFVIVVDTDEFGVMGMAWEEVGERICSSSLFEHGTNVEFVRIRSANEIEFRIYERGCGPTASSGTGTCASAAAVIAFHGLSRKLTAISPGGSQHVVWTGNEQEMMLTGPAEIVCTGEVYL